MLWVIAVAFIAMWILGFLTTYTLGGWGHLLLVAAAVVILLRVIQVPRPPR
jgi:hypothetical protein